MQEEILRLIELQNLDLEILKIEKAVQEVPQSLQKVQKEKDQLLNKIENLKSLLDEKNRQKNLFEEELKQEYQRLKSTQARLVQIRGTREYQLLLREIEEIKKANKQKEEELLKLMEEIEKLEQEKAKLEEEFTKVEDIFNQEKQKFDDYCSQLNQDKEKLLEKRISLSKKIPSRLLKKYELLRERKGGLGIAPVDNYVCEGCYMAIPPQLYNEIQRDNRYYECPHCKRLIFYKKFYFPEESAEPVLKEKNASSAS
ncbi:hypothetical protein F1847_01970 [Thermodesulfobacterium sp. TA1]|uniref:zinc ribbon domain-containing protein n=1 Tax=Thermodesulfobacterium sp. TA1 TaxID=2234087 RepID=UPI00123223E3|nr:C4-type zinc ribbon domain-containing protein [Thermodesulfobacterium sp. TA1]QER41567.1 hypothetical protein F1847_01970 [Thermodesulfobacterium sp. TA1]